MHGSDITICVAMGIFIHVCDSSKIYFYILIIVVSSRRYHMRYSGVYAPPIPIPTKILYNHRELADHESYRKDTCIYWHIYIYIHIINKCRDDGLN